MNFTYPESVLLPSGHLIEMMQCGVVVVGTGSAGYCAATRLVEFGVTDVVMVTDKVRAGTSRNAGSDKQTYYKLTLAGSEPDSVREMARTLFEGGAMDGDNALVEAALSAPAFLHLCEIGVPFPRTSFGEYVGYKTDHDPRQRATSVGPYTSRAMVEALERRAAGYQIPVLDECRLLDLVVHDNRVVGVLLLRRDRGWSDSSTPPLLAIKCDNVVLATGGPAALYATSVFPHGQWGASGAGYRAGAAGKNVTEWQFGLASIRPRWNVSGSYMQVIPRFISTQADGSDPREFLVEALGDCNQVANLTFLKGYQWPFDVRKAFEGSSVIDLLVYRETTLRGRRVFLDFRQNVNEGPFRLDALGPEARSYLVQSGSIQNTPIERLLHMNRPAYEFYLEKNPGIDLRKEMLEVSVCAQHNNGGLAVDAWWQSTLKGLFPVGEAAGAHGVYRPGGAALNSGQVGATRAVQYIASHKCEPSGYGREEFEWDTAPLVTEAVALVKAAQDNRAAEARDPVELLRELGELMSQSAGPVRSGDAMLQAQRTIESWHRNLAEIVALPSESRRMVDRLFLARDAITTALVYCAAMRDFARQSGGSRGSVLYSDAEGDFPAVGDLAVSAESKDDPEIFRFRLAPPQLDALTQEVLLVGCDDGSGTQRPNVQVRWRPVRPIPSDDLVFENVWREYREELSGISASQELQGITNSIEGEQV